MPIEPSNIGQARPVGAIDPRTQRLAAGETLSAKATPDTASASAADTGPISGPISGPVQTSDAVSPGAVPVDAERVSVIRKAIESGTYPVVPTKIADAVIAAGLLLRSAQ